MLLFHSCIRVVCAFTPHVLAEHLLCVRRGLVCPRAQRWPHHPHVGGAISTWPVLPGGQACCVLFEDNSTAGPQHVLKTYFRGISSACVRTETVCHSRWDYVGFSVVFQEAPCSSTRVSPGPLRERTQEAPLQMLEP